MTPAVFDSTRVLADGASMRVLLGLANRLRCAGYQNEPSQADTVAVALALGHPVPLHDVGAAEFRALVQAGAGDVDAGHFVPRFTLFALGDVLTLVPKDGGDDPGRVYFGHDSVWLADLASRVAKSGGAVADLGTGAGTVAAAVASRHDVVVATEIVPRTAACAAITFALNPRSDGKPAATACVADVASGLATGAFSLVTGNPPWVPDLDRDVAGPTRVFAEGGATGFELPRRFIVEGAALLAPGGVMVMLALDATWADGARPLHSLARGLMRLGLQVSVAPTELSKRWENLERSLCDRVPGVRSAAHAAVVVHRPLVPPPIAQAVPSASRTKRNSDANNLWVTSSV